MYTKVDLFNIALSALLLTKEISNADEDTSLEAKQLRKFYTIALKKTLADLDLDGTSTTETLELLIADPNDDWSYAYKYPSNCMLLRRICSGVRKDNRASKIPLQTAIYDDQKVIFCDLESASADYIPSDLPLSYLSVNAGLAVAYSLAWLCAPLIAGKGANELRKNINQMYLLAKSEAQEDDRLENTNFDDDEVVSEFVLARTT